MNRITSNVLQFTDWSAGEIRKVDDPKGRLYLTNWQAAKCRRSTWILMALAEYQGTPPTGYILKKQGEVIETGEFKYDAPRPYLTTKPKA